MMEFRIPAANGRSQSGGIRRTPDASRVQAPHRIWRSLWERGVSRRFRSTPADQTRYSLRQDSRIENPRQYLARGLELDPKPVVARSGEFVRDRNAAAVGVLVVHGVSHAGVVHRGRWTIRLTLRLLFLLHPGREQLLCGHRKISRG